MISDNAAQLVRASFTPPVAAKTWILAVLVSGIMLSPAAAQVAAGANLLKGKEVTERNLVEALTPSGEIGLRGIRVQPSEPGVLPPAPDRKPGVSLLISFNTSSSELTAGAKQQLDTLGSALKNNRLRDYKFIVEGHADPRGDTESNMVLSRHRADSVRNYLVSAHGIGPERLTAQGKGDLEVLNRTFPAAPENRRVTIFPIDE